MPKALSYTKGAIIYFEGDKDNRIFILKQGAITLTSVDIKTKATANTIVKEPGTFFGIKSAMSHSPREETVTVLEPTVCVVLNEKEFEQIFSTNKALIMKMLRIFSNELRAVHKKTSEILNQNQQVDIEEGLLSVANSFYEAEKWRSCIGISTRLLKLNPSYASSSEFKTMIKTSQIALTNIEKKEKLEMERLIAQGEYKPLGNNGLSSDYQSDMSEKAFDTPALARFAKTYQDGEIIIAEFERGESFYLIQQGIVQLTKCVNGANKNLDILKPGEMFGEMAILDNSPRSATCVAKGKVDCLEINKENFEMFVSGNPKLALMLLNLFCKRILDQKRRFKILILDDNYAKIADVFCMFDETGSLPPVQQQLTTPQNDKKTTFSENRKTFSLTIQDIAHWAGLSYQTTKEEISRFISRGMIQVYENYIIVEDINDMRRIVQNKLKIMNMKANK